MVVNVGQKADLICPIEDTVPPKSRVDLLGWYSGVPKWLWQSVGCLTFGDSFAIASLILSSAVNPEFARCSVQRAGSVAVWLGALLVVLGPRIEWLHSNAGRAGLKN
jgi:hypothetical protein